MNKFICISWVVVSGVIFSTAGCSQKPSRSDVVLARASNHFITLADFNARINKMPQYYRNIVEKDRMKYLDDMMLEMLFYEDAVRKGIDSDREIKDLINEAKRKIVISRYIKHEVDEKINISEEALRIYYEDNKEKFRTPPLWRASHILVPTEQAAQAAIDDIVKGASFEDVARRRSTDTTASRGGDVGYFRMGQLVPDFERACTKLEVGQTSGIVHTPFGYHVIKLTAKKESTVEPFEKVRGAIENELKRQRRDEVFDRMVNDLKARYGVEITDEAAHILKSAPKNDSAPSGSAQQPEKSIQ